MVYEELWLLDFPEFAFAPSLQKRRYVTVPAAADIVAAADTAATETATQARPSLALEGKDQDEATTGAAAATAETAASPPETAVTAATAATATAAAFLRNKDLRLQVWGLDTAAPQLLLGDFSFKGERQQQLMATTALFRIENNNHNQQKQHKESNGDTEEAHAELEGIAARVISFTVDITAGAAATAAADTATPAAAPAPNEA